MKRFFIKLSAVFLLVSGLAPAGAEALSQDQLKALDSGIYYFNTEDTGLSCATYIAGADNEAKVWNYLRSQGLSAVQTAGIMGNLKAESGFNPKRVENGWGYPAEMDSIPPNVGPQGQPGYGIAQWTSPNRKQGLQDKANSLNQQVSDLGLQLSYLWDELTNKYTSTYDLIKQSSDIAIISATFGHEYEGFGTDTEKDRLKNAVEIQTKYGSSSAPDSSGNCDGDIQLDPNFKMTRLNPPLATPGGQITPKGVTLHWWGSGSGGRGIDALVSALRGNGSCGTSGCSVQIGITADGKVYQMTKSLTDLTYHAAGGNETTFGIEIEGGPADFGADGITKYPAKFNAVVATVKYLVAKYNLPLAGPATCGDVSGIHPHKDYNHCLLNGQPQNKTDIDDTYFNAVMQKVRQ